ncbi:MAG: hypothetical protein WAM07_00385 [Halobacillus sp.]|uniref:hypothetical protein n=1 Tax=Halobacillus sp. TaxID=56800 RepID=UPI003BB0A127
MPKKLTYLSSELAGWASYYVSFNIFNFLDQFGAKLGDYIFGISDFIMKKARVGLECHSKIRLNKTPRLPLL